MKKLSSFIYGVCLVAAIRHALSVMKRSIMHPMVLYQQMQICLRIDTPDARYLVLDAAVMYRYSSEMMNVLNSLTFQYKYMFSIDHGIYEVHYNALCVQLLKIDLLTIDHFAGNKTCTLDTLPFHKETATRMANDVRRLLKHRMRVIE